MNKTITKNDDDLTKVILDNGFYYAYTLNENKKAIKSEDPIDPDTLEVVKETQMKVNMQYVGWNQNELIALSFREMDKEATKYAHLSKHKSIVAMDDHRKPGENTTHIKPDPLEGPGHYVLTFPVLLMNYK